MASTFILKFIKLLKELIGKNKSPNRASIISMPNKANTVKESYLEEFYLRNCV